MQILISVVRKRRDKQTEQQDTGLEADRVTIGSAADRDIQLIGARVEPEHAEISGHGTSARIKARGAAKLLVNDAPCTSASLGFGDRVDIAGHKLTLVEPPAGYDLAIQVEPNSSIKSEEFERSFRTDLDRTWLSKRAASWILLLLVGALGLGLPYFSAVSARSGHIAPPAGPTDAFWSSGTLVPAHAHIAGNDCSKCHADFFVHVKDTDCKACHAHVLDHADQDTVQLVGVHETGRCAQCHRDHDAIGGSLIIRADAMCVSCHGSKDAHFDKRDLISVSRFAQQAHPDFKATVLDPLTAPGGLAGSAGWKSVRRAVAEWSEKSNLEFDHRFHLSGDGVAKMGCQTCHQVASEEHFKPITMEDTCSSVGCHALTFDVKHATRVLQHRDRDAAIATLQELYIREAHDPAPDPNPFVRRPIPNYTPPEEVRCSKAALDCGRDNAADAIKRMFTDKKGCTECHPRHEIKDAPLENRYQIASIKLVTDYFPDMRFPHDKHRIMKDAQLREKTGDDACEECHKARESKESSQLLIPDIKKCLTCHADQADRKGDQVELRCVSCHAYHPREDAAEQRMTVETAAK